MERRSLDVGMKFGDLERQMVSAPYDVEAKKSSHIQIIPEAGLITKTKKRNLDNAMYEVASSILMSELFRKYSEILGERLYTPECIRLQYNETPRPESGQPVGQSITTMYFCPGVPFNKMKPSTSLEYKVGDSDARIEDRMRYLSGMYAEIMTREGIAHSDSGLRHFFLLPHEKPIYFSDEEGIQQSAASKNGLGIIDVENTIVADETTLLKDQLEFKRDVTSKLFTRRKTDPLTLGVDYARAKCDGVKILELAEKLAKNKLRKHFGVADVNFKTKEIDYL